jgi:lipoprotein signal peptidase
LPGRHAVVDFLHFYMWRRGSYEPLDFPAFNVADSAICTGVALILLINWRNDPAPRPTEG